MTDGSIAVSFLFTSPRIPLDTTRDKVETLHLILNVSSKSQALDIFIVIETREF